MQKKSQYISDNIKSLDRREWYKLKVFDKAEIDPLYIILGFVQEYFGGYALNDELVDMFFVNEYEKALALKRICERLLSSQKLGNDVILNKLETGHSQLKSTQICEMLKSQFTVKAPRHLGHNCYHLSTKNDLFRASEELSNGNFFNFKRLSYLIGIILRNRVGDNEIVLANAPQKAELAIKIITEFEAFGDKKLNVEYHFNTPHATKITLLRNNIIWNEIAKYT
jgi:hypothetical protein